MHGTAHGTCRALQALGQRRRTLFDQHASGRGNRCQPAASMHEAEVTQVSRLPACMPAEVVKVT